ncbi:hypothetical protein NE237_007480 [Protea cynaroides]|uniref:Glucosamine/galactosamine-6-phosphate isomerase domain-containing protein n=1 Tax=Protea cynaroides TaxID=273540 RepID=A0A9Q0KPJ0_9MAGN|nr:hypothetical protein NE237_007480 [Protea cynaroides]
MISSHELRKCDLDEKQVRGFFAIAFSNGSLISLMGKLCEIPYNNTVDWLKWYISWANERVVAKNHADSNCKLAKDGLLSKGGGGGYGYSFTHFELENCNHHIVDGNFHSSSPCCHSYMSLWACLPGLAAMAVWPCCLHEPC